MLRGIKEAALINLITTLAKLVPILLFIVIVGLAFDRDIFTRDIWGRSNPQFGGVLEQVRNMILVTVFVFIGIEGASVYSSRAKRERGQALFTRYEWPIFAAVLLSAVYGLYAGHLTL